MKGKVKENKVLSISQMALMSAIICVATLVIQIPTGLSIGYVHLGDSMIFLAAVLFGRKKGAICSAVGMTLADLISGYAYYMPFTFVIKGIMAYIAGAIAWRKDYNGDHVGNNILGFSLAGIWMVVGYFVAKIILARFFLGRADNFTGVVLIAIGSLLPNMAQAMVGIIIAVPLIKLLGKRVKIQR